MKTTTKRNYRQFHAILNKIANQCGDTDVEAIKADFVRQFTRQRTTRASEMTNIEYQTMIAALKASATVKVNKTNNDLDATRKRVMAAIGGWLRLMGIESNAGKIKAIACKAALCTDFNKIPLAKLRGIYAEFTKQQKALQNCKNITAEIVQQQTFLN